MLQELLGLIAKGHQRTPRDLAAVLNTTPGMIEQMALQLTRMGYLEEITQCGTSCDGCESGGACLLTARQKVWVLTARGRRAAVAPA